MIANFFSKTKPINFLVLSVIMIIVYIIGLKNNLTGDFSLILLLEKSVFTLPIVLLIFILNFIIRKNILTEDNTYAILLYILMFGFFSNSFFNKSVFFSNFILLFAFRRIYSLRSDIETKKKIFDSAFWIGIASMFYIWSFIYLFLIYGAFWIFRKRNWKNIFLPIIGFVTPVFLLFVYQLLVEDLNKFYDLWVFEYSLNFHPYTMMKFFLPIIFLLILGGISIFPTTKKSLLSKIDIKSNWTILMIHIFLSFIIVIIAPIKNGSEFLFFFFPLGILFANYLQFIQRYWVKELILYLFLIMLIITNVI
ncbi:MAG: DUF6427 family protein [Flavobacteriaceae bacterium]|nr:DUF6427 family protein [Flavobacteriaceae bacterium]